MALIGVRQGDVVRANHHAIGVAKTKSTTVVRLASCKVNQTALRSSELKTILLLEPVTKRPNHGTRFFSF